MRRPPPLKDVARYPVTGGMVLLAIGVTLAWMAGWSIEPLVMNAVLLPTQPWRLVTSALPHVGLLHLAFDAYWIWVFGTALERFFGHARFVAIVLVLAAGSAAADFAFVTGGVGLSGVAYGLFGMVCVMAPREKQLADTIDSRTILLFVGWFFFCIVTTIQGWLPVANVAHAAGAGLGALLGWIRVSPAKRRALPVAVLGSVGVLIPLAATIGRPTVNLSLAGGQDYAVAGYRASQSKHLQQAIGYYRQAIAYRYSAASSWYDLGVALYDTGSIRPSIPYFAEAVRRDPGNAEYRKTLAEIQDYLKQNPGEAPADAHAGASQPTTGESKARSK